MMENLCCGFELCLEDAYNKVKWKERVRPWEEVSEPLEKGKILAIIIKSKKEIMFSLSFIFNKCIKIFNEFEVCFIANILFLIMIVIALLSSNHIILLESASFLFKRDYWLTIL